jgi:hypothetical protein
MENQHYMFIMMKAGFAEDEIGLIGSSLGKLCTQLS